MVGTVQRVIIKMAFPFRKTTNKPMTASEGVVIAENEILNLQLLGAIQNGGAMIPISHNKGIKFVIGQPFKLKTGRLAHMVTIQIVEAGIGREVAQQSWNRTKTVVKKAEPKKATMRNPLEGKAIEVDTKVEQESLF